MGLGEGLESIPEFGEVWGNVSHLGHLDWADTTCNHTQWLCLATYTGNQKKNFEYKSYLPLGQPTWAQMSIFQG